MKGNELRIGNIIYWDSKGKPDNNFLCTHIVKSVDENDVWVQAGYVRIERIKPMPINKSKLILFGFYWTDENNEYLELQLTPKIKLTADISNNFSTVVLSPKLNEIEINSIHQLQNLYYVLTGEELNKIEL